MGSHEKKEAKAERLLRNNAVKLCLITERGFYFESYGDTDVYLTSYDRERNLWFCSPCRAKSIKPKNDCSHIIACRKYLLNSGVKIREE